MGLKIIHAQRKPSHPTSRLNGLTLLVLHHVISYDDLAALEELNELLVVQDLGLGQRGDDLTATLEYDGAYPT